MGRESGRAGRGKGKRRGTKEVYTHDENEKNVCGKIKASRRTPDRMAETWRTTWKN